MSGRPPEGQVFVKSGSAATSLHGSGAVRHWRELIRKRRGRPPDERVAAWAARIEGPEFGDLDSLRAKCRELAWIEYQELGGDPDKLTTSDLVKLAEQRRVALMRWYKKHR
jgi:ADP-ribose pyrophosphatase YjhB (NUDIX family)